MISRYEALTSLVTKISKEISKISATEMRRYKLRGPAAKYLLIMKEHGSPLTSVKLSRLSGRDKAEVSRAVGDLLERGLLTQTAGGRYRAKLSLTTEGVEVAEDLSRRAYSIIEYVGKDITDSEREILYRSLESISNNLKSLNVE